MIMNPISIREFVNSTVENNPGTNKKELTQQVREAVDAKRNGACCIQCGQPIWAVGSAIVEWNGCFTCITGEADASDDYEIDLVNF